MHLGEDIGGEKMYESEKCIEERENCTVGISFEKLILQVYLLSVISIQ